MPHGDKAIALQHRPATQRIPRALGYATGIGNVDAFPVTGEGPAMKGAGQRIADDPPAIARQVRAQVRAMCVEHRGLAGLTAKQHQINTKIMQPLHGPRR